MEQRRSQLEAYPGIVEAARENRVKPFVVDGKAVMPGVDGVADFDGAPSAAAIQAGFSP